eukprot:CAMPEP_0197845432 /NCGR_PEP_ID=MMETSP1438-20131217/2367_1 /TAXON_ID=1461541 /ORGANISM="Pterosperma sp., Strain CCMP1384" /LENGTH=277 /DNA_ID=CAMNT_0043456727 /DNA_START=232 /DNA_END=1062 /DNA_ORIENTATION=-
MNGENRRRRSSVERGERTKEYRRHSNVYKPSMLEDAASGHKNDRPSSSIGRTRADARGSYADALVADESGTRSERAFSRDLRRNSQAQQFQMPAQVSVDSRTAILDEFPFDAPDAPLIYVWDFDQTILKIHSFAQRIRPEDVQFRNIFEDTADLIFFRMFVDRALKHRAQVAIASFGQYETIKEYMDHITPGVFNRTNISTPMSIGERDGQNLRCGKVPQLDLLMNTLVAKSSNPMNPRAIRSRCMFFDDQLDNIRRCNEAGYIGIHTPYAFTEADW